MPEEPPSFFALISDIHANIDALEAVFEDLRQWPCRGIFCLGDIVGYGPEPAACVQRVMDSCAVSVLGNHEAMLFLVDQASPEDFGETIGEPLALAARQLSSAQMAWLRDLPISADLDPITLSHASLHEPGAFHYPDSLKEARSHFAAQTTAVSFHGHTHVPVIWEKAGREIACYQSGEKAVVLDPENHYAINVGSVGQPRNRDSRACYTLYDFESRLLLHRRVEYDLDKAQARFEKAGLPAQNASRLRAGR